MSVTLYNGLFFLLLKLQNKGNICTSVRRSSRSMFGWPTGNDVSGHLKTTLLPSSAQTSTQLQFEADLALFSFYPPPTHPSGQVVTSTQTSVYIISKLGPCW